MRREKIAAPGKYKHPLLAREDDRMQILRLPELFDHPDKPAGRLDLPLTGADAVKSAAALRDADKQGSLL